MDCSPPGSSVHGTLQARILEWVAISYSRQSSRLRDWTDVSCVSCLAGGFFPTAPVFEVRDGYVTCFGQWKVDGSYMCYFQVDSLGFPGGSVVKNLPEIQETWIWSLSWEDPLEKRMATYSSILAWRIPCLAGYSPKENSLPGRLQSMELQRVRHSWVTNMMMIYKIDKDTVEHRGLY